MYFAKVERIKIDGKEYEISNASQVEIWNCKTGINDIYLSMDPTMFDMNITVDNYLTWKKDLVSKLKAYDKLYTKHIKSGYVEMNAIHTTAMQPLTDLLEANLNLHFFEELMKKKEMPKFRHEALEEKFIGFFTRVCDIFRDFGRLKDYYHIKQMLTILKTEAWKESPPLSFYFTPLLDALTDTRDCMLKMHKEGHLHCKYIIEDNAELQDKTIVMVKRDIDAQWLAGDELKQDQFKFMYSVMKIIYDSALRDALLNDKKEVIEGVLPALVAY